jgi:hypothetical protein
MIVILLFLPLPKVRGAEKEKIADIYFNGKIISTLYNEKVKADNHIIYEQIRERGINENLAKKREIIILLKVLYPQVYCFVLEL